MGSPSGRWADRCSPRPLLVVGGTMFCAGLVATSFVTAIYGATSCTESDGLGEEFSAPVVFDRRNLLREIQGVGTGVAATGSGFGTLY